MEADGEPVDSAPRTIPAPPRVPDRLVAALAAPLAAVLTIFFIGTCASRLVSEGLCCADDSIFSTVSRNLVDGVGYATTIQMDGLDYQVRPFDPIIGTGPTVILPAALLTALFGNQYWVPGCATMLLWISLLAVIWVQLERFLDARCRFLVPVAFFGLSYLLFPFHFEQWCTLLGEIPAALLLVLSAQTLTKRRPSGTSDLLAGAAFALAVLSKVLSLLWLPAFVIVLVLTPVPAGERSRRVLRAGRFAAGAAIPLLSFELVQLFSLGMAAYREHWSRLSAFSLRLGLADAAGSSAWSRAGQNYSRFVERFSISPGWILVLAAAALAIVWRSTTGPLRGLATLLFLGVVAHFVWWLWFSIGWPRYAVIGLVVAVILVSIASASGLRPTSSGIWVLVLFLAAVPSLGRLRYPFAAMDHGLFRANTRTRRSLEVVAFVDARPANRLILTQWWAMAAAFDYLSGRRWSFKGAGFRAPGLPEDPALVLVDERFLNRGDRLFEEVLARSGSPLLSLPPYKLYEYSPQSSPETANSGHPPVSESP
jgi:hypothetical protein